MRPTNTTPGMGCAISSEAVPKQNVLDWAHAGRVCPVLTTGGAVGLTEGPKTQATCATETLLP